MHPASAGLTSHTQQMRLLSKVASNLFTSFTLREHFMIYIKEKSSTQIWGVICKLENATWTITTYL